MTANLCFWFLMLTWLVFGFVLWNWPDDKRGLVGNHLLLFILFALLGWHVFGPALR